MRGKKVIITAVLPFVLISCGSQDLKVDKESQPAQTSAFVVESLTPGVSIKTESSDKTKKASPSEDVKDIRSPDTMADHINKRRMSIQEVWRALEIPNNEYLFEDKDALLEAQVKQINLGKDHEQIKILQVSDERKQDGQFMFFKEVNQRWVFCGKIDNPTLRGNDLEYEILNCGDKKWFKTSYSAGRGTGFSRTEDGIYCIVNNKLSNILTYPTHEHLWMSSSQDLLYNYDGGFDECWSSEGGYYLKLSYQVTYTSPKALGAESGSEEQFDLFTYHPALMCYWDNKTQKLVIDKKQSDPFTFNNDMINFAFEPNDFLINFQKELKELASQNDSVKTEWLKTFVQKCDPSNVKDEISKLFESTQ